MAMTAAQVLGAVPVARLGRTYSAVAHLKLLVVIRALAFSTIAFLAAWKAPFVLMIIAGAAAGFVNGAASGYMRAILNYITRLLKSLGIAATLNEVAFVAAPVAASLLGSMSPPLAIATINFWSRIKPAHATDGPKRRVRPREWLSLVPHKTSYLHPC